MGIVDIVIRVALALALGGLIGLERQLRDQPAGFRTHTLVCLGSTIFTLASIHGFDAIVAASPADTSVDPSRIAAQVVVGIGFLGAGAIIRHGASVRGLTTAASLWTVAALGLVVGLGWYSLAGIATAAIVIGLSLLRVVEEKLIFPRTHSIARLEIVFRERAFGGLSAVVDTLDQLRVQVHELETDRLDADANRVRLLVELPAGVSTQTVLQALGALESIEGVASH